MGDICIKKKLFGKEADIILYDSDKSIGEEIIEEVYEGGLRLQKIFNFFDKSSELSLLNKKRKIQISDELRGVILKALKLSKKTDGNYDIALGKQILRRKKGEKETPSRCSYKNIIVKKNLVEFKILGQD